MLTEALDKSDSWPWPWARPLVQRHTAKSFESHCQFALRWAGLLLEYDYDTPPFQKKDSGTTRFNLQRWIQMLNIHLKGTIPEHSHSDWLLSPQSCILAVTTLCDGLHPWTWHRLESHFSTTSTLVLHSCVCIWDVHPWLQCAQWPSTVWPTPRTQCWCSSSPAFVQGCVKY